MDRATTRPPTLPKLPLKDSNCSISNAYSLKENFLKRVPEKGSELADSTEKLDKEKWSNGMIKKTRDSEGYVGFANLPNQVYRKAVKRGFDFTVMVVGASGLGKSTLINSMFLADVYGTDYPGPTHRVKKTIQVETTKVALKENGVKLSLTVVDTPGFGDAVDNSNCWLPIIDYIDASYEEYLNAESRVDRVNYVQDNRVHCCLYFISPTGHGLKPLDIEFMKRLHDKVNIIPVIAKADTLIPEECSHFKKQIMNEINSHDIKIYEFPPTEDEEGNNSSKSLKDRVPMAVVGSNTVVEFEGKKLRGRRYPWGVAEVENMEHCDFLALRNVIVKTHLQDLKEVTHNVHYENFRCRKLNGLGVDLTKGKADKNPLALMEEEKKDHDAKMKKMESEMEQVFEIKVQEKMQKLKDLEDDLQKRGEKMKEGLEAQIRELEEKRRVLEEEKKQWELTNGITLEELKRKSLEREEVKDKKSKKKMLF